MSLVSFSLRRAVAGDIELLSDIDDDAGALYEEVGLPMDPQADDPFVVLERERWLASLRAGTAQVAIAEGGEAAGFYALGMADGLPYLEQLSVRRAFMRQGVGTRLLEAALEHSARDGVLWLTTYDHLSFNRLFYEREGFSVVPEMECGPELRHMLELQRRCLPAPDKRIAMRHLHAAAR